MRRLLLLLLPLLLPLIQGCDKEGCLSGDDPECVVPSPCTDLTFDCDGGTVSVVQITSVDQIPEGMTALAAVGDYLLQNDQVTIAIDHIDHPHYLAPSGGTIIDIERVGQADDAMRHVFQATGLLPEEQPTYTDVRLLEGEGFVAIQFRGHLANRPDLPIATRYELRPCDPGVRVRTEAVNLEPDPLSWALSDGYFIGGKESVPFTVGEGTGFEHRSFGLSDIGEAYETTPYFVISEHTQPGASYATVACNVESMDGFFSNVVAAVGMPRRVTMPRDYEVFERFIAAGGGPGVSGAADLALEVRRKLFNESWVLIEGRVVADGDPTNVMGTDLRAVVHISEGAAGSGTSEQTPWTEVRPDTDGNFAARVPADRDYVLRVDSYGRQVATASVSVGANSARVDPISIPAVGQLDIGATIDGVADHVMAFVHPADDATRDAVESDFFHNFDVCAPLLGPPHGRSPACNRVLLNGRKTVAILPGLYDVFAVAGPFSTMGAARRISVAPGETISVDLALETLPALQPAGTLSGDFHVHGAVSFDSSVPHLDRVKAFLAARTEVIAATDHDVIGDYGAARLELNADERLELMVGVETTGHILWKILPENEFPQVVGHWIFFPMPLVADAPYRGAAWDELIEPGQMFTDMRDAGWDAANGIAQLNHPIEDLDFGRDLGWANTLGLKATEDLPTSFDGTMPSLFLRTPPGADFANSDYHTQEVLNGTENHRLLSYRAFWHYLLNQGVVRAGTANSDSHGLTDSVLGTPRTLVWTDSRVGDFDAAEFNGQLRAGRAIGTNGPIIEATMRDASGAVRGPSTEAFDPGDLTLSLRISAAPWVPVEEVRIVVNGAVVRTLRDELSAVADPFGADGLERLAMDIDLSGDVPASGDAWIVVEAGHRLEPNEDLDCDGFPDTGDNNRDGVIDWRDVEGLEEDPGESCMETVGPLTKPDIDLDRDDPHGLFEAVTPGGYPASFTNPFLLDRDGNGFSGVAR